MKHKFNLNDIWRAVGILLIVIGAFTGYDNFKIEGLGLSLDLKTNFLQICGAGLIFLPFILKEISAYKERKQK